MPEDDETESAVGAPGAGKAEPAEVPAGAGAAEDVDEYGVGRLLALSDGVFGVAMTLIVLDIAVPVVQGVVTNEQAIQALLGKVTSLAIFGFSFGIVGIYWINHHRALRRLRAVSTWVLRRNLGMLLLICLVPFASAFFERFNGTTIGDQVYLGTLFLLGLMAAVAVPWSGRVRAAGRTRQRRRRIAGVLVDQVGTLPIFAAGFVVAEWYREHLMLVVLGALVVQNTVQRVLLAGYTEET